MSTGYQITDQEGLYYLTFQIVDRIDVFTRQMYRDIVIDSLKYAIENKGPPLSEDFNRSSSAAFAMPSEIKSSL